MGVMDKTDSQEVIVICGRLSASWCAASGFCFTENKVSLP